MTDEVDRTLALCAVNSPSGSTLWSRNAAGVDSSREPLTGPFAPSATYNASALSCCTLSSGYEISSAGKGGLSLDPTSYSRRV